jgi:uncharacterized protein
MPLVTSHPTGQPIWFDLQTRDAAAARAFYAAVLGWTYQEQAPEYGGYAVAFKNGAVAAGIGQQEAGATYPSAWSIYFGVADADAACARIGAAGGTVMMPTMVIGDQGRMAMCADPTGAVFGVWEPIKHWGAECVNQPGAMVWCEVNTRDATRASKFYADVFGLTIETMEMQGSPYHMLKNHGQPAAGVLQMTPEWGDMPPHWMAYFGVTNAEEAKAAIQAHGGTVPFGPFDTPYGRMIVARDPQGAHISFITAGNQ